MSTELPPYEQTQGTLEEIDKDPRIRFNVKQSAKGFLYYEFTVKGDTIEEVKDLAKKAKKELEEICR